MATENNRLSADYSAWVWDPRDAFRCRGFATARLSIIPDALFVEPTTIGRRLCRTPRLTYEWPAVVIERLRPFGGLGLLVQIDGYLGRVAVRAGSRGRLRDSLLRAGFHVVEIDHVGWEAPKAVNAEVLGEWADAVPPAVVVV